MGEVDTTFLIRRIAQRYVEIFKKEGHSAAYEWWANFPYGPSDEEAEAIMNEVRDLLNRG